MQRRANLHLEPEFVDINPEKLPDPTIKWVDKPPVNCTSVLHEKRKRDNLSEQQKFEKNFETHANGQQRIENREACILRLTFKGLDTVTFNKRALKERRVKEMIEDMTQKFGNQVLGVHGAELPKFAGNEKDQYYWTLQQGYNPEPRCNSLNLMKQEQKYWAVNDEVKLSDTTGLEAPVDPFKTVHCPKKSKFNIANKVTQENHWPNSNKVGDPDLLKGWKPTVKWSEKEASFKCVGADRDFRTFDKIIDHSTTADKKDLERQLKTEELLVKQAPKSLQNEVAMQIQLEKQHEASLKIGANRMSKSTRTRGMD
jgi:hypothetical protein